MGSDDIESFSKSNSKDDLTSIATDVVRGVNLKVAVFLFALMIFVFSDSFIDLILGSFSGAVESESATTKGTIIQIIFVVIGYIIIDLLVQGGFL